MKTICTWGMILLLQLPLFGSRLYAQSHEAAVLLLNIEKLNQLREILDKMYDGYKLVSDGYTKIKNVTSGNFQLHDLFLDALFVVNPTVRKYRRVVDIVEYQLRIVQEYKAAYRRFQRSGVFKPEQLVYIAEVYGRLTDDSLKNLDELLLVITARKLRMSDDERITAIDRIFSDVQKQLMFLRRFNNQQNMLAIERTREQTELNSVKNLYGIE
ncbi:TerB family tellurite resistance protein [Pseudoflavitalea sp. X16]|uniref:TerB family tellurite resistance protein n=1 Tax=Paraflavitalea devenefica TaxID=2716334 RepID=UPI0014231C6B|nr:TerB family tellurite resistance protein [Paraflavitalea devenefica]NII26160.1 TerB family tellurite resistance protein [Paraflavitalea devenefica]